MSTPTPAEIRSWAREHGFVMPDRGPLSAEVRAAYAKAHRSATRKPAAGAVKTGSSRRTAKVTGRGARPTPVTAPADDALARTVAELSRRVGELENHVAALRARPVPAASRRLGRRR